MKSIGFLPCRRPPIILNHREDEGITAFHTKEEIKHMKSQMEATLLVMKHLQRVGSFGAVLVIKLGKISSTQRRHL